MMSTARTIVLGLWRRIASCEKMCCSLTPFVSSSCKLALQGGCWEIATAFHNRYLGHSLVTASICMVELQAKLLSYLLKMVYTTGDILPKVARALK